MRNLCIFIFIAALMVLAAPALAAPADPGVAMPDGYGDMSPAAFADAIGQPAPSALAEEDNQTGPGDGESGNCCLGADGYYVCHGCGGGGGGTGDPGAGSCSASGATCEINQQCCSGVCNMDIPFSTCD